MEKRRKSSQELGRTFVIQLPFPGSSGMCHQTVSPPDDVSRKGQEGDEEHGANASVSKAGEVGGGIENAETGIGQVEKERPTTQFEKAIPDGDMQHG